MRIELYVRVSGIFSQSRELPPAWEDRIDVKPIVEDRLRLQRETDAIELEPHEFSRLLEPCIASGFSHFFSVVQVNEGAAMLKHLAALKCQFHRNVAELRGVDFQVEGAEELTQRTLGLGGDFKQRGKSPLGGCRVERLDVFLLLDGRETGVPLKLAKYLFYQFGRVRRRHEDGSFSH